jgi:hypothetical protein
MSPKAEKTLAEWLKAIDRRPKKNLVIYQTRKPEFEPEMLSELARQFRIKGKVQSKDGVFLIAQGRQVLTAYKETGAFWYADLSKLHHPNYRAKLPSKEKASKIATEFLGENKWLPDSAILDGVNQSVFERVEGKRRQKRTKHPNSVCVEFRFSYGSLKTYGPGAKIKVFLGQAGEIIGLFHAVPEVEEYAEAPVLSRSDLEETLSGKLGVSLREVKVKDVKLVYLAESCVTSRRFIQPAYVFDLATQAKSRRSNRPTSVEFEMHPVPATSFAPIVLVQPQSSPIRVRTGESISLSQRVKGGTPPFKYSWESNLDGHLGEGASLETAGLSVAHRDGRVTSHTIKVTVTDSQGLADSHEVLVTVNPRDKENTKREATPGPDDPDDPYVGVEWCNNYDDAPGLVNISGTDDSARGFKNHISVLSNWSSRFDWGNDAAWEQDFKYAGAPGGGTDSYWADNVHFAFFAGHGSSGSFWFNSSVDDHEMRAQDARLGDGLLNWLVLHACQTMRANFEWDVWCDAFQGLHQMFGFHTNTEGSTPPLGSRFAWWMAFGFFPWSVGLDMQSAWEIACTECFDSSREYAIIYAGQSGTDTHNDHLPGYGHVSSDPTSPNYWAYYRGTC